MKAMILAAGRGERMRPLTDETPKPLLHVAGKRLIEYHIENLQRAGVQEVVINHAWLGSQLPACLGTGQRYGLRIYYSDEGDTALETAGGVIQALPFLGADPFILVNADVWTDYEYSNLHALSPGNNNLLHLILVKNPEHNPGGDFGLDDNNRLLDEAVYTYSGIGVYSPQVFSGYTSGVRPLAPIIRDRIQAQQATGEVYCGAWTDVGTPARLNELDLLLSGKSIAPD